MNNNDFSTNKGDNDTELLANYYRNIIELLGEDTNREGLLKTPMRVAKAMQFMTSGYKEDPESIIKSAMFHEE